MPRMNDSPAASIAFWFASEIIPASATTVTSRPRRAHDVSGSVLLGSFAYGSRTVATVGPFSYGLELPMKVLAAADFRHIDRLWSRSQCTRGSLIRLRRRFCELINS